MSDSLLPPIFDSSGPLAPGDPLPPTNDGIGAPLPVELRAVPLEVALQALREHRSMYGNPTPGTPAFVCSPEDYYEWLTEGTGYVRLMTGRGPNADETLAAAQWVDAVTRRNEAMLPFTHTIPGKLSTLILTGLDQMGIGTRFDADAQTTFLRLPAGTDRLDVAGEILVPFPLGSEV